MARQSIQEYVYEQLKSGILTLRLEPGKVLSTYEIASQLEVSRTPVREAFLQLQAEHLLNMIPQKETIVSYINLSLIEQEKFIRESLEIGASERILEKQKCPDTGIMSELIERQIDCINEMDYVGFVQTDDLFHKCLFDFTEEEMAWKVISSRNGHYNRFRVLFIQEEGAMDSSVQQHYKIVQYLRDGDKKELRRVLQNHVRRIDMDLAKSATVMRYSNYFISGKEEKKENLFH